MENRSLTILRSEIEQLVSAIQPFDSIEQEHLSFIQNWLASGAELFRLKKPNIPDIHLVSYFLLTDTSANKILLVDHKKASLLLPTGGHVEPIEHPNDTVKREIHEELGISADFLLPTPFFATVTKTNDSSSPHTDVSLWYLLKGDSKATYHYDKEEFHNLHWFEPHSIPYEKSDPHLKRCLQKLITLQILPDNVA